MCAASISMTAFSRTRKRCAADRLLDHRYRFRARGSRRRGEQAGFDFLDAPVSGGVGGAEAGTLTFMCGGSETAFERARPILEKMGKRIVLAGGAGAGQAAKICNNMLLAISMIGTCEAFVLAEKLGLDAAETVRHRFDIVRPMLVAVDLLSGSGAGARSAPSNRGYQGGFAAALMLKDLKLSQAAAQSVGRHDAAWRGSGAALFAVCRKGPWRARFLRHHPHAARRALALLDLLPLRVCAVIFRQTDKWWVVRGKTMTAMAKPQCRLRRLEGAVRSASVIWKCSASSSACTGSCST